MVEGEVIEVMGKIVSGLADHQEDLVSFLRVRRRRQAQKLRAWTVEPEHQGLSPISATH